MTLAQRVSQTNPLSGEPGQQTTFTAFPEGTLLEAGKVPIAEIAELALREGQCTNPIYRVHRWFARPTCLSIVCNFNWLTAKHEIL